MDLVCQIIDHEQNLIGSPFVLEAEPTTLAYDVKENIFMGLPRENWPYITGRNLRLWKVLLPLSTSNANSDRSAFSQTIKEIELPDPESEEAYRGTGTVKLIGFRRLSLYWEESPTDKCHLHLLVQMPDLEKFKVTLPPTIKLLCHMIDEEKNLIDFPFVETVPHAALAGDLRRLIHYRELFPETQSQILEQSLKLWKILTPLPIETSAGQSALSQAIRGIEFPSPRSEQALRGNGAVQILDPSVKLSTYWREDPFVELEEGFHLQLVVQIPFQ